jgi:hypothetical protein
MDRQINNIPLALTLSPYPWPSPKGRGILRSGSLLPRGEGLEGSYKMIFAEILIRRTFPIVFSGAFTLTTVPENKSKIRLKLESQ